MEDGQSHMTQLREDMQVLRAELRDSVELVIAKPMFRGFLHLVSCFVAAAAAVLLALEATGRVQLVSSVIYGTGLTLALATSAVYHRGNWRPRMHAIMQRIDHSMIFVLVAATYTPVLMAGLSGALRAWSMVIIWTLALGGIVLRVTWYHLPRAVLVASYVVFGWIALAFAPLLVGHISLRVGLLMVIGGVLYTVGALVYAGKRPDPLPRIFGYHEVFHTFVVAAACCHFFAVMPLVTAR